MKKIFLISVVCLSMIMSCEENNPPKPECEIYHTGTVTVVNKSPNALYVDVTEVPRGWNDERYLPVFQQTVYHMSPGTVYLYSASPSNYLINLWVERTLTCTLCKNVGLNWLSGSKGMIIEIDADGNVNKVYNDADGIKR